MIFLYFIYSYVVDPVWWHNRLGDVESFLAMPNMPGFCWTKVVWALTMLHQCATSVTTMANAGRNGPLAPHTRPCALYQCVKWMGNNPPNKRVCFLGELRVSMALKALICLAMMHHHNIGVFWEPHTLNPPQNYICLLDESSSTKRRCWSRVQGLLVVVGSWRPTSDWPTVGIVKKSNRRNSFLSLHHPD
jgi:hypothetical protein